MKNLSKLYKELDSLRLRKKSFNEIEKILLRNGHELDDVNHVVNRIRNEEISDYNRLVNEVDDFNYRGKILMNIVGMIAGVLLVIVAIYFSYKFYDVLTTPNVIVKEHVVIHIDGEWKGRLSIGLLVSAVICFMLAFPVFGAGLGGLRKGEKDRARFVFLRERGVANLN